MQKICKELVSYYLPAWTFNFQFSIFNQRITSPHGLSIFNFSIFNFQSIKSHPM